MIDIQDRKHLPYVLYIIYRSRDLLQTSHRYRCLRSVRDSKKTYVTNIYHKKTSKSLELTSQHWSGKDIQLTSLVVAYQFKSCDTTLASCIADIATRILHFPTNFLPHNLIFEIISRPMFIHHLSYISKQF